MNELMEISAALKIRQRNILIMSSWKKLTKDACCKDIFLLFRIVRMQWN
jgi:hypothetical protein